MDVLRLPENARGIFIILLLEKLDTLCLKFLCLTHVLSPLQLHGNL